MSYDWSKLAGAGQGTQMTLLTHSVFINGLRAIDEFNSILVQCQKIQSQSEPTKGNLLILEQRCQVMFF